jgi:hypothetical protein
MVETTSSWLPHFLSNIFAFISPPSTGGGGSKPKKWFEIAAPEKTTTTVSRLENGF